MDFKKFASGAEALFNRAKQYTEEKLGQAEKTDYDAPFELLLDRAEKTKKWTEMILKQTETVLTPNPSARVEEFVYEKVQGSKPQRMLENDVLGQNMIDAGNDFGHGNEYGSALIKCGHTQQKLGQAKRDFMQATTNNFLQQLKAFLDTDMKTLMKEKKILETKRLDLDAAKAKLRRAKTQPGKDGIKPIYTPRKSSDFDAQSVPTLMVEEEDLLAKAEAEVRVAQRDFDRQVEVTRLLLEGVSSAHTHHQQCLHDFIEAEAIYYAQCHQYMTDLQKQLGSYRGPSAGSTGGDSGFSSSAGGRISPPNFLPPASNQFNNCFSGY